MDRAGPVCRGVRGAIQAPENSVEGILGATRQLLEAMVRANGIRPEEVASIFFTVTPDLNAAFPALAARRMGWLQVPLLCAQEVPVPDDLPRCIRILLHWNTLRRPEEIVHVYLGAAAALRPDLSTTSPRGPAATEVR